MDAPFSIDVPAAPSGGSKPFTTQPSGAPNEPHHCDLAMCQCESVWTCVRDKTRLRCQLGSPDSGRYRLTLLRNSRTYGHYEFDARDAALTFATRLRATFEGNGWQNA